MQQDTGHKEVPEELPLSLIKQVKIISNGRICSHEYFDVTRIEKEDDGSYTVVVEE